VCLDLVVIEAEGRPAGSGMSVGARCVKMTLLPLRACEMRYLSW